MLTLILNSRRLLWRPTCKRGRYTICNVILLPSLNILLTHKSRKAILFGIGVVTQTRSDMVSGFMVELFLAIMIVHIFQYVEQTTVRNFQSHAQNFVFALILGMMLSFLTTLMKNTYVLKLDHSLRVLVNQIKLRLAKSKRILFLALSRQGDVLRVNRPDLRLLKLSVKLQLLLIASPSYLELLNLVYLEPNRLFGLHLINVNLIS